MAKSRGRTACSVLNQRARTGWYCAYGSPKFHNDTVRRNQVLPFCVSSAVNDRTSGTRLHENTPCSKGRQGTLTEMLLTISMLRNAILKDFMTSGNSVRNILLGGGSGMAQARKGFGGAQLNMRICFRGAKSKLCLF